MGRDKALLSAPPFRTLLERQLAVLGMVGPCELIVSAREDQVLPTSLGMNRPTIVRDDGESGPLAGLVSVLRAARSDRVLVLAVDLACIDPGMLRRIVGATPEGHVEIGVIPRTATSSQPLAALWPRTILPDAEEQLAAGTDFSLRTLVTHGVATGRLRWLDIPGWDEHRFANWNRPADRLAHRGTGSPFSA